MAMFDQNTSDALTPEEALAAVCGEGKKYATPAEMAKALLHADTHITVLESENADLRKKGDSSAEVQELLKAFKEGKFPTQQAPTQDQGKDKEPVDIDKKVEEILNTRLGAQAAKENQSKVIGHFKEHYGTRAGAQFDQLAKELDMDKAELEAMAAQRPQAVINLASKFLGTGQPGSEASLRGDHGTQGTQRSGTVPSTKSEILKQAEAEKWPRNKKYEVLNREASKAAREGRLDAWNR